MEVKIGVQYAPRELVIETAMSREEIEKAVSEALRADLGVLALTDEKGRLIMVPGDKLAYIELGEETGRRVGFGTP